MSKTSLTIIIDIGNDLSTVPPGAKLPPKFAAIQIAHKLALNAILNAKKQDLITIIAVGHPETKNSFYEPPLDQFQHINLLVENQTPSFDHLAIINQLKTLPSSGITKSTIFILIFRIWISLCSCKSHCTSLQKIEIYKENLSYHW